MREVVVNSLWERKGKSFSQVKESFLSDSDLCEQNWKLFAFLKPTFKITGTHENGSGYSWGKEKMLSFRLQPLFAI